MKNLSILYGQTGGIVLKYNKMNGCTDLRKPTPFEKTGGDKNMEYMTVKEASELWGYPERTIQKWCRDDQIAVTLHAEKVSNRWRIPKRAQCPKPIRKNGGK